MKNSYLFIFLLLASSYSYAQEPADALRYSYQTQSGGTARNQAIGGAGASLGGEFTSLFINPAGLGFYNTGDFVITPSYVLKKSKSNYLGNGAHVTDNNFNLGASGFLYTSPSKGRAVKAVTVGIGVNKTADFTNQVFYSGVNNYSSYSEKYLEQLIDDNVTDPNDAATQYPYGTSLAFNTYLLNPEYDADSVLIGYSSLADASLGVNQQNMINTSGGITDVAIGTGLNLKDKWFFGGTVTFPILNYHREASYKESDASDDMNNSFNYFEANETLDTKGIGINGKFGVIYKPVEFVRLGLAFHSPTIYHLTDNFTTQVITDLEGYGGPGIKQQSSTDLTDGQPLESTYNLSTPWKVMLSGSYVFREVEDVTQQRAFITADVEYVNYKNASFRASENDADAKTYYHALNEVVDDLYKSAINVRLGGEIKFNTVMFRLGGAYYGNPYITETKDLMKISGGVGYRNKGIFIDLTYVHSIHNDVHYPYLLGDKNNAAAMIKNIKGNIVATIGFKI